MKNREHSTMNNNTKIFAGLHETHETRLICKVPHFGICTIPPASSLVALYQLELVVVC
jgi:hypothetical protein